MTRGPVDSCDVLVDLRTRALGQAHEHHAQLESTNDRAAAWAADGAPHGALVTADQQTAGRGRLGRAWFSPPGQSLYASVVLRPGSDSPSLGPLALAVGLGLRDGLLALGVPSPDLKWPNDLLVGGKKLAGILCEARWSGRTPEITVGFGVNVHTAAFPSELQESATSLARLMEHPPGRAEVLLALLAGLEPVLDSFFASGFPAVMARYIDACVTLGREVRIGSHEAPQEATTATAERIDETGALWVTPEGGGPQTRVQTADVWLIAPSDAQRSR